MNDTTVVARGRGSTWKAGVAWRGTWRGIMADCRREAAGFSCGASLSEEQYVVPELRGRKQQRHGGLWRGKGEQSCAAGTTHLELRDGLAVGERSGDRYCGVVVLLIGGERGQNGVSGHVVLFLRRNGLGRFFRICNKNIRVVPAEGEN